VLRLNVLDFRDLASFQNHGTRQLCQIADFFILVKIRGGMGKMSEYFKFSLGPILC